MRRIVLFLVLCAGWPIACTSEPKQPEATPGGPRGNPPTARRDMVDLLRDDLAAQRHASDGGGRAWLDVGADVTGTATVTAPGRWAIVYEAGPLGIAAGGMIFLQVSPFWGWSTPQVTSPDAPGYTEVTTTAEGVELRPRTLDEHLLGIELAGRALAAGERVRIVYGAGPAGALADRFAERGSRFWIAVDGDGDGVRQFLADSPAVDVAPGPPARLVVTLPTTAAPGESVRLTVAALDRLGNAGPELQGEIAFPDTPAGLDLPQRIELLPRDKGRTTVSFTATEEGVYRIRATGPEGLSAESNPMLVSRQGFRIWWGDLHGHSNFSDGTGTPEDYFTYARDVAALDVAALTDHDHWGTPFLDQHPEMWDEIRRQVQRFHAPGRFVTLLGYEWTSWIYGHRHVLYFGDEGKVLSCVDPAFESPQQLWAALRGRDALTFAHHSAGGPIATDWSIPPDPALEPVTEVVSVHGCSEADDCPSRIYQPQPGNFVRDALDRGYRLGFVGSGDGHDGHPGLAQLAGPSGGLAAIMSETLTREGVREALRARRVYATNGPRIYLRVTLDGNPMGSTVPPSTATSGSRITSPSPRSSPAGAEDVRAPTEETGPAKVLSIRVVAPGPIASVELVRGGKVAERFPIEGTNVALQYPLRDLRRGEYVYVRVVQQDGGLAWSSPFFIE